jgi:hypothetical protein
MLPFSGRLRLTCVLVAAAWLPPLAHGQAYRGLYVVAIPYVNGNATNKLQARAYKQPFIDGVEIPLHWSFIEPVVPGTTLPPGAGVRNPITNETFCPNGTTHTNFCWQELDEQLAYLDRSKKLSLAVIAGGFSPSWLSSASYNVASIGPVPYASHGGTGSNCYDLAMPLPSSAASALSPQAPSSFAAAYVAMMKAVAAHLSAKGLLSHVAIIKISGGANTVTEEFHIDSSTTTGTCLTDVVPLWAAIGYRPGLVETSWEYIAAQTAATFPHALPSFDLLESSFAAAPLIDDAGTIFTPAEYDQDPSAYGILLLDRALAALVPGGHAAGILGHSPVSVQWDGVLPADQQTLSTVATHTLAAAENGAILSWQTNEMSGVQGSSCGTAACAYATSSTTPCYGTETCVAEYASLLDNGIKPVPGKALKASVLEVWSIDVQNTCLQPALVAAHNALIGDTLAASGGC